MALVAAGVALVLNWPDGQRPELTAETLPPLVPSDDQEQGKREGPTRSDRAGNGVQGETRALEPGQRAKVLITPTGVVVPVVAETPSAYLVTTPCGANARVVWGTPIFEADIVLDPGHGGSVETGAVGPNGLIEKDLNLDIAKRTARLLERQGISVVLTRTADYRMPLSVRAEVANSLAAEAIISIHHNAPNANPSTGPGTEIFIQQDSPQSRRLGGILWEEITGALEPLNLQWTAAADAGAVVVLNEDGGEAYGMIRRPEVPAVLAELAYISNPEEAEFLNTDQYRNLAATALADGILRWLGTTDTGAGFVDQPRTFTPSGLTGGSDGCEDPDLG